MTRTERLAVLDRQTTDLPLTRQCQLVGLNRSSVYYQPVPTDTADLHLMKLMDKQYLQTPFYGSRKMVEWLATQGYVVNRKRVQRLMQRMGIEAIYPRPKTSKPVSEHKKWPYLLRGVAIERVHQVWSTDITYIPMPKGFLYLVAVIDWHSRYVLSWRLSNTLESGFCVDALGDALELGTPEIFNSDQGSQFTSEAFTGALLAKSIQISMDGRGRCLDNIFIERLWRSLKYEEVYLKAYEDGKQARAGISRYFRFYNEERLHQSLEYLTPRAVYEAGSLQNCLEIVGNRRQEVI